MFHSWLPETKTSGQEGPRAEPSCLSSNCMSYLATISHVSDRHLNSGLNPICEDRCYDNCIINFFQDLVL